MSVLVADFELVGPHELLDFRASNFSLVARVHLVEGLVDQETLGVRNVLPDQVVLRLNFEVSLEHELKRSQSVRFENIISLVDYPDAIRRSLHHQVPVVKVFTSKGFTELVNVKLLLSLCGITSDE